MTTRGDGLRDLITRNPGYKLVSLAFALMFWVWVQSDLVVEDRIRVRLEWKLPEGLMLVEPPLETATLSAKGVQAYMRSLRAKDLSIPLDLSRARAGEVSLDLSDRPVHGLPAQVTVIGVSPDTLRVSLDHILKQRVSVIPVTRGQVAEGYKLASVTVQPERVELYGPSTVLRAVKEVQTDEVDLTGLKEDAEVDVALQVKKGQLAPSRATAFVVKVDVEPLRATRKLDHVPVMVRDGRFVADISEAVVTVEGPEEALGALEPDEVGVMVYVPEDFAGQGEARRAGKDGAGLRFEVVGAAGEVAVVDVQPDRITVRAK
jgi:YbbR domain-containing protein